MKILSILVIIFTFSQCGGLKLENNPPFKLKKASYSNWVGGQQGVSGTKIELELKETSTIVFDSIYFKKKSTKVEINTISGKTVLIGHFNTSKKQNRNLILDVNITKEIKNTFPKTEKIPFELNNNDAILSYRVGDKIKYFKIENIKREKPVFYPRARK